MVTVIVEVVPLAIVDDRLVVAVGDDEGSLAQKQFLRGGLRLGADGTLEVAVRDVLRSNGLTPRHIEQVLAKTFSESSTKPLQLKVVYIALHEAEDLRALQSNGGVTLKHIGGDLSDLAADNRNSLTDVLIRLQSKAEFSTLVANFLPQEFTLAQLQMAYEVVLGKGMNSANFRRKILDLGALKETGVHQGVGRPARLYRLENRKVSFKRQLG